MTLEETLRTHVLSTCLPGEDPDVLQPDDELIDSGILDSLGIMQLVSLIERDFRISIPTEDIDPEHFSSVRTLSAFVQRLLDQPRPG